MSSLTSKLCSSWEKSFDFFFIFLLTEFLRFKEHGSYSSNSAKESKAFLDVLLLQALLYPYLFLFAPKPDQLAALLFWYRGSCRQHCTLNKAFSHLKSFPLPQVTDCFQHRVNLWAIENCFCNFTEQTEMRLYFMKKRLYASVQFNICCGTFCELRNDLLSGGLKILFATFTLGCRFSCEEHHQTSSSVKESRAFTSAHPKGAICCHSWLFDRKISSYQFFFSLSFSEENLWYCYGESKAVPLLSVLSCFCLIQMYSSFLHICFLLSLVFSWC